MLVKLSSAAAAAVLCVLAAALPASAVTWEQVPSGTTQDILAIDYQDDSRAWFATSNGQIFTADANGTFVRRFDLPGVTFTDVAFRPDGRAGIATAADGTAYRSLDGGQSWSRLTLPIVRRGCLPVSTTAPIPALYAAAWAGDDTAYLVGGGAGSIISASDPVVVRVTGAAGGSPTAVDANWTGTACRVGTQNSRVTDVFAVPGNPNALRFMSSWFGSVYASGDGLASIAQRLGETLNEAESFPRFAIDPDNPNRVWAVDHGNVHCNELCFAYSLSGGASKQRMVVENPTRELRRYLFDVAYAGGTTVAVGDNGEIFASTTTGIARDVRAGGALTGHGWRAVDVADGSRALVGGTGGVLLRTRDANATPDSPSPAVPTPLPGTDPGRPNASPAPTKPRARQASKPITRRTGSLRATLWRRIDLSEGRFVPVRLASRARRRVVIVVRPVAGAQRPVVRRTVTVPRGTTTTFRLPLRRDVRPGRYRVTLRVLRGGHLARRALSVPIQLVR